MKKVIVLSLLLLLLHQSIWILGFSEVEIRAADPPFLYISAPVSSPVITPTSPISASMAAFSPGNGIQMGSKEHKMGSHKKLLIALIVASSALGAILLSLSCLWIYQRKNLKSSHKDNDRRSDAEKGIALAPFLGKFSSLKVVSKKGSVVLIDYKTLEKATNNFRESDILGEGGFGCVYKARLDDNHHVAVKKINSGGQDAEREFENEVDILSKIQHSNIISLLGYSIDGEARLLVYELMHNGSLETQLHGPSHGSALSWHIRMKTALDIARGLEYLHEHCNPPVIHRDLKSSNILLDSNFNAVL